MKRSRFIVSAFALITFCTLSACHTAEKSAGMALDNANSVVKTGQEKLWVDPNPTARPTIK